ncbi:MAG: hypothetical protein IJV39_03335 [Ruminococcus sp.]|nr:hypothetical protein [Ruminococcus sp.]
MKYKIGFNGYSEEQITPAENNIERSEVTPVKSVVQVHFPSQGRSFSYYNDRFDLHIGDTVFVDGKLEGVRGIVTDITYSFKIKLSDYKQVIAVADTCVKGEFHFAGSHLIAFNKNVIPYEKILGWVKAPEKDIETVRGKGDDDSFWLKNLSDFPIRHEVADRGFDYYNANKVIYLCLDGTEGKAIVDGTKVYEVEFDYNDGEIRNIICDCFCSYHCKHEFAVLLQLRETLKIIEKNYPEDYDNTYFAAISKSVLLSYTMDSREKGSLILE